MGTKAVILQGQECFSVAQMYNLIYPAVYRSKESYQKQGLSKRFSGRLTVSILKQRIEFYIKNEYPIKPFTRLKGRTQPILSLILFCRIVGTYRIFKTVLTELLK